MTTVAARTSPSPATVFVVSAAMLAIGAVVLYAMGHPAICTCGYVKLWHGATYSSETSQHLSDWYTLTHVIHGLVFYAALWLVARRWPVGVRLLIALFVEVSWEVFENSPLIINHYREANISLGYFGDSVINSFVDTLATVVGFGLAWRLPVWGSVAVFIALETIVGYFIRDNLTLIIIMLLYPMEAISVWQAGG